MQTTCATSSTTASPVNIVHYWPTDPSAATPCGLSQDAPIDLSVGPGVTCRRCLRKMNAAAAAAVPAAAVPAAAQVAEGRVLGAERPRVAVVDHLLSVGV